MTAKWIARKTTQGVHNEDGACFCESKKVYLPVALLMLHTTAKILPLFEEAKALSYI